MPVLGVFVNNISNPGNCILYIKWKFVVTKGLSDNSNFTMFITFIDVFCLTRFFYLQLFGACWMWAWHSLYETLKWCDVPKQNIYNRSLMVLYLQGATMGTSINLHFTQNNVMKCSPCDTLCNVIIFSS